MDRNRCDEKALLFNLYRHDEDIEREAIRKYCKFHRLHFGDLHREALLVEIQMSSLSTIGWAFADVEDWSVFDKPMGATQASSIGGCIAFDEPNTLKQTASAWHVRRSGQQDDCNH